MERLLLFFGLLLLAVPLAAQTGDPPEQIQPALNDLAVLRDEEITLNDIDAYEWQAVTYEDASLGCPRTGRQYAQVVTEGFQFRLEYENIIYDYRVSEDGEIVVLCTMSDGQIDLDAEEPSPCQQMITVVEGDTLVEIADRCETTVQALVEANEAIETRDDVLIPGMEITIPGGREDDDPFPLERDVEPRVAAYPLSGPPGTTVQLIGNGLPPNTRLDVGLGLFASEYSIIDQVMTSENGAISIEVTIPERAEIGRAYVVLVVLGESNEVAAGSFITTEP